MKLEVEQKYPAGDLSAIETRLVALGVQFAAAKEQSDAYFAHPARDFAQTDEALRIRRVGHHNYVTYKGPKQGPVGKTRRELEFPLMPGEDGARQFAELLVALGFRPVATVAKRRRTGLLTWHGLSVEAALDEVAQVGSFVELETSVEPEAAAAAQQQLSALGAALELSGSIRTSYLEMLLSRGGK